MFKFIFASTLIIASINNISSCSDSNSQQDHQFLLLRSEHEKNVAQRSIIQQQTRAIKFRLAALYALCKNPSSKYQKSDFLAELANIDGDVDTLTDQSQTFGKAINATAEGLANLRKQRKVQDQTQQATPSPQPKNQ